MKNYIYLLFFVLIASCSDKKSACEGGILNLEINSFEDPDNKILSYYKTNDFVEVIDSVELLKFGEKPWRVSYILQGSSITPGKRKFTYKVKRDIIKTDNYTSDLIVLIDNDEKLPDVKYWLKSFNKERKKIGHLDFASWSDKDKAYHSGRIDCDSSLHIILDDEHRVFTIDKNGDFVLKTTIKK